MKHFYLITKVLVVLCFFFTANNINALNRQFDNGSGDVYSYIESNYHIIFRSQLNGVGDESGWNAEIDRTSLPSFSQTQAYGVFFVFHRTNADYLVDYGLNFYYTYNIYSTDWESSLTYMNDYGTMEYDGVGIYQIAQDPIHNPAYDEQSDGAYFYSSDTFFSANDEEVEIFIYDYTF